MNKHADNRRAAAVSIDHFVLSVPSIDEAHHFSSAFGLQVRKVSAENCGELELRALDQHQWARILASSHKSSAYLSFNCFASDIELIAQHVRTSGDEFAVDTIALSTRRIRYVLLFTTDAFVAATTPSWLAKSTSKGWCHVAWDVNGIDQVGAVRFRNGGPFRAVGPCDKPYTHQWNRHIS
jgi:hypothetical protein